MALKPDRNIFSIDKLRKSEDGPRKVVVYLPPGPTVVATTSASLDAFTLPSTVFPLDASVVRINYRLGSSDLESPSELAVFPTPIHEVATAFSYLTSSMSRFNENEDEGPKICLLGSHIGGALATMLALTEPNSIHALAVSEPMLDWVGLDEVLDQLQAAEISSSVTPRKTQAQIQAQKQAQKGRKTGQPRIDNKSVVAAVKEMIKLRSKLFKTPSAYFDPFASPMLFLRAPGRDTPTGTMGDQMTGDMGLADLDGGYDDPDAFGPYDDDWQPSSSSLAPSSAPATDNSIDFSAESNSISDPAPVTPPRRRKVLRRWPAVGNPDSVILPRVKIFVQAPSQPDAVRRPMEESEGIDIVSGHAALMRAQGSEMVELLRRACFVGREKGFAEERVKLELRGQNLQHGTVDNADEVAIKWLGEMFQDENDES
ncbi:hypothetical protein H2200_012098 [Cladophialophora chaetospira]|uniref:BD-FAE-like domain-containing protein n=1 Tax=Cladophialophora chaetospira TaxID=386627 RepID=A0AA39CCM2_9EURO|nr:hypothetical protein H2200_012098 [Cladophialophora chaetospira]